MEDRFPQRSGARGSVSLGGERGGPCVPQGAQGGMDVVGDTDGQAGGQGRAHELVETQCVTGGVDERVRGQGLPGEPVAGQVEPRGQQPEDLVVE